MTDKQFHSLRGAILLSGAFAADSPLLAVLAGIEFLVSIACEVRSHNKPSYKSTPTELTTETPQ